MLILRVSPDAKVTPGGLAKLAIIISVALTAAMPHRPHGPLAKVSQLLAADPAYVAWRKGRTDVRNEAELMADGLQRLSANDLELRTELMAEMLEKSNTKVCGGLVRGDPQALEAAVAALPTPRQQELAALLARAVMAAVHDARGLPYDASFVQRLMQQMPAEESSRLSQALAHISDVGDVEACWAGRTLYQAARAAPPAERAMIGRAFVER